MRHDIPKENYRSLYFAFFKSHLQYFNISVFGNANKSYCKRLFIAQKNCLKIVFGDLEAYLDKFNIAIVFGQKLEHHYYQKEHTMAIFHPQKILSLKNLYLSTKFSSEFLES